MQEQENARLMSAKRKLIKVIEVPMSRDQPFQVTLKRNGVFLHGCKSKLEVDAYLFRTPVETLMGGAVKTRRSVR